MRRAAFVILTFLLLGAVMTVIVAWLCERYISVRMIDTNLIARERRTEFEGHEVGPDKLSHRWVMDAYSSAGAEIVRFSDTDLQAEIRRSGWPFRSMCCEVEHRSDALSHWTKSVHGGMPIKGFNFLSRDLPGMGLAMGMQGIDRVLPRRPLWIGFLLDSLFFAMSLWILWMMPRWMRSVFWGCTRKCMRCGYPVGISQVCTECGGRIHRFARRGKNLPASALNQ
jgi:hypothetical protein